MKLTPAESLHYLGTIPEPEASRIVGLLTDVVEILGPRPDQLEAHIRHLQDDRGPKFEELEELGTDCVEIIQTLGVPAFQKILKKMIKAVDEELTERTIVSIDRLEEAYGMMADVVDAADEFKELNIIIDPKDMQWKL